MMRFTYNAYRNMIFHLKSNNYDITNYHDYKNVDRPAILRHDIDSSIGKALELAKVESEMNVSSTYFLLLSSDFYNVASFDSITKIKKIVELGHEIGLHFDETKYLSSVDSLGKGIDESIKIEADILGQLIETNISTFSMHRPSKTTLEANYSISNIVNSYGTEFFKKFKYLSDSRRCWREDVDEIIASNKYDKLHILTHAFWYNEVEKDINHSISDFVNSANMERYLMEEKNIRDLSEIMKISEVK